MSHREERGEFVPDPPILVQRSLSSHEVSKKNGADRGCLAQSKAAVPPGLGTDCRSGAAEQTARDVRVYGLFFGSDGSCGGHDSARHNPS